MSELSVVHPKLGDVSQDTEDLTGNNAVGYRLGICAEEIVC